MKVGEGKAVQAIGREIFNFNNRLADTFQSRSQRQRQHHQPRPSLISRRLVRARRLDPRRYEAQRDADPPHDLLFLVRDRDEPALPSLNDPPA